MITIEGRAYPMARDAEEMELRYTGSGTAMLKFKVASYTGKDANGDYKPKVYWTVMCWDTLAEHVAESVRANDEVIVVGQAQANNWEDSDGRKHYDTEIRAYNVGVSTKWNPVQPVRIDRDDSGRAPASTPKPKARDAFGPEEAPF
jgi:single-stranded DNA-binding protein